MNPVTDLTQVCHLEHCANHPKLGYNKHPFFSDSRQTWAEYNTHAHYLLYNIWNLMCKNRMPGDDGNIRGRKPPGELLSPILNMAEAFQRFWPYKNFNHRISHWPLKVAQISHKIEGGRSSRRILECGEGKHHMICCQKLQYFFWWCLADDEMSLSLHQITNRLVIKSSSASDRGC